RLSFFEQGLVVLAMKGAGATVQKKLILPPDAVAAYTKNLTKAAVDAVPASALSTPMFDRRASLRVYDKDAHFAELRFDPIAALPKKGNDWVLPLQDLLRALSEDRTVTNTIAGYEPKAGDHLVGDDRKTWEVTRVIPDGDMVVLRCLTEPTTIYVAKKDLYNYFIGSRAAAASR
ncbi:MAG TPA: hypothetical protein VEZ11_17415, partial [Thermoanaerobaculia bacterium]|nr:hypothetical protein [Thermoanaerobaculia bacterium]